MGIGMGMDRVGVAGMCLSCEVGTQGRARHKRRTVRRGRGLRCRTEYTAW